MQCSSRLPARRFCFSPFLRTPTGLHSTGPAGDTSNRNEAEIDAALQEAGNSALANRDGTMIVMDARTGRVRAIVNPQLAYAQALMPGSAMKPFTALAALRAELIDESSRTVCPGRFTGLNFSLALRTRGSPAPVFAIAGDRLLLQLLFRGRRPATR